MKTKLSGISLNKDLRKFVVGLFNLPVFVLVANVVCVFVYTIHILNGVKDFMTAIVEFLRHKCLDPIELPYI